MIYPSAQYCQYPSSLVCPLQFARCTIINDPHRLFFLPHLTPTSALTSCLARACASALCNSDVMDALTSLDRGCSSKRLGETPAFSIYSHQCMLLRRLAPLTTRSTLAMPKRSPSSSPSASTSTLASSPTKKARKRSPSATSNTSSENDAFEDVLGKGKWKDWPAPMDQIEGAREFFQECARNKHLTVLVPDKDADGCTYSC